SGAARSQRRGPSPGGCECRATIPAPATGDGRSRSVRPDLDALPQILWQRRTVPNADRVNRVEQTAAADSNGHALTGQKPPDAIDQPRLLLLQRPDLPLKVAGVFLLGRGHVDNAPESPLSGEVPQQHREQLLRIEPVRLDAASPAVDFDRGRVHDQVLHTHYFEKPMEPESVLARLVAAED